MKTGTINYSIIIPLFLLLPIKVLAASFDAQVKFASEYVTKRGISLTDNPALQAELSISNENIGYVGIWGSNVDIGGVTGEIDIYVGKSIPVNEKWAVGMGAFYYENIGDSSQNFAEYFADISYDKKLKVRYNYTDNFSGLGISSKLIEVSNNFSLMKSVGLFAGVSHVDFNESSILDDFSIIRLGVNKKFGKSTLSFDYSNTDSDQFNGRAGEHYVSSYTYKW